MPRYNKYTYDNRNFSSIKALAQYAGVNEKNALQKIATWNERGRGLYQAVIQLSVLSR